MNFDPKLVDLAKSGEEIGLIVNFDGELPVASDANWDSIPGPVPFMGVDGGSYVLMPDGKVYPNE